MKRRLLGHVALSLAVLTLSATVIIQTVWAKNLSTFDQLDLLVDVRQELVRSYVTEPDEQAMIESAVRGMVASVNDPYTVYLSPEDLEPFEESVHGKFTGIGAEVDMQDDRIRIVSPLEDSPAWKAGVQAGDVILEINGEDTAGLKLIDAVSKLKGPAGTDVSIKVHHRSGEDEVITITRAVIEVNTVRGFRRNGDNHDEFMLDKAHGIAYIRLTQFNERSVDELTSTIKMLQDKGAKALIFDLRFNPGGLLESAIGVSDLFLTEGKRIVSVKGRTVPENAWDATAETLAPDLPLVVLVNEASASASEIVTGALRDNNRAHIVGTRTFGKGSVQQVRMLEAAPGAIKITNAYYYIPSGRKIHRVEDAEDWGVDPTEGSYVPMNAEQMEAMVDVRREAALNGTFENGNGESVAITPAWIVEKLKDPQLAAAVTAAIGKIETGQFPAVGQPNEDALIKASQRENLQRQIAFLKERVIELESELEKIEAGKAEQTPPAE